MSASPIQITGTVIGAETVVRRLSVAHPETAIARLRATVRTLGYMLERIVKLEKLNGQVLQRRSGRLMRSINTRFISTPTSETARVGTALSYGRIWELTGSPGYTIFPKTKRALFWPGAAHPVASVFHPAQAPRPFLKPALNEMRPVIHQMLDRAMRGG